MLGTLVILIGVVWAAIAWARYPKTPNVKSVDVREAIAFIGTDDFNKLTESHRRKYCLAIADRLKEKTFPELLELAIAPGGDRRAMQRNIEKLKDKDEIGGAFMRVGLDKFFELSKEQRDSYFFMWAMAEKLARSGGGDGQPATRPSWFRRPATQPAAGPTQVAMDAPPPPARPNPVLTPERFEKEMTKFLANQPPRTTAQMSEMMNAMRKKREVLGLPDR